MKTSTVSILLIVLAALLSGARESGFPAGLVAPVAHAAERQQPPPQQDDEFVPVKDLANQEQLPAAPLVIGAYAVAWIAVFLYLWSIWRRLSRVEHEIASLSRRIGQGARPGARQ